MDEVPRTPLRTSTPNGSFSRLESVTPSFMKKQIEELTELVKAQDETIKKNNELLQAMLNRPEKRSASKEKIVIPRQCSVS